ncbi:MAG: hypothetical protein GXX93_08740 [Anaerolineae bacterium]|nr:hypothetical protein [Anaerolineae bacterium]
MRSRTLVALAVLALLVAACGRSQPDPTSTPVPTATTTPTVAPAAATPTLAPLPTGTQPAFVSPISPIPYAHRGIPLDSGRSASALTWYNLAEEAAHAWYPEAQFLGIAPSFIMERNLPFLPSQAGWFYRFGRAEDALEFYIQVANGTISGSTEAEAIGEREQPVPVDLAAVALDSDDVRALYLATPEGEGTPDSELDYTLAYDTNLGGPVWWVWNVALSDEAPVLAVDAATGDTVPME